MPWKDLLSGVEVEPVVNKDVGIQSCEPGGGVEDGERPSAFEEACTAYISLTSNGRPSEEPPRREFPGKVTSGIIATQTDFHATGQPAPAAVKGGTGSKDKQALPAPEHLMETEIGAAQIQGEGFATASAEGLHHRSAKPAHDELVHAGDGDASLQQLQQRQPKPKEVTQAMLAPRFHQARSPATLVDRVSEMVQWLVCGTRVRHGKSPKPHHYPHDHKLHLSPKPSLGHGHSPFKTD